MIIIIIKSRHPVVNLMSGRLVFFSHANSLFKENKPKVDGITSGRRVKKRETTSQFARSLRVMRFAKQRIRRKKIKNKPPQGKLRTNITEYMHCHVKPQSSSLGKKWNLIFKTSEFLFIHRQHSLLQPIQPPFYVHFTPHHLSPIRFSFVSIQQTHTRICDIP